VEITGCSGSALKTEGGEEFFYLFLAASRAAFSFIAHTAREIFELLSAVLTSIFVKWHFTHLPFLDLILNVRRNDGQRNTSGPAVTPGSRPD
jgi:hypothetical protein